MIRDKNGTELRFGATVRIKRTLNNGKYKSDAYYKVEKGSLEGIELRFFALADNGDTDNQFPLENTLCERYNSLDIAHRSQNLDRIAVPDTYGENHNRNCQWKQSDYSEDIELIPEGVELKVVNQ